MKAIAACILAIALSIGCATMHSEGFATLHVDCNVADAAVLLDDVLIGRISSLAGHDKAIRPGFYRVEIKHPSYHSYFAEVNVAEGGVAAIKADLHPLLD